MTEITSSHNEALKEVRKLAGRRWRDKLGEFVAEGEDLLEAADAAGWHASARYAAKGSGLDGIPVAAARAGRGLPAGLGHARDGRLPAALVARRRAALRRAVGRRRSRATSARSSAPRSRSARPASRSAPAAPTRTATRPCARRWARCSPSPSRACARSPSCPGRRIALVAREGAPLRELPVDGELTLVVGAEREGLPADIVAACDDVAHIPIAHADSLNAAMAATVALYDLTTRISRP